MLAVFVAGCAGGAAPASNTPSATRPVGTSVVGTNESADQGNIEGTVTNDELSPLEGASVSIAKLGATVTTDAAGGFAFHGVPVGDHNVIASALGYEDLGRRVTVKSGETTKVGIVLRSIP